MLNYAFGVTTDKGPKQVNEDNYFLKISNDGHGHLALLAIIADGMGGYQIGDKASQLTINKIKKWWKHRSGFLLKQRNIMKSVQQELEMIIHLINDELVNHFTLHGIKMGTTLSICFLYKGQSLILHVGDCRIYHVQVKIPSHQKNSSDILIPGLAMQQCTVDHTWVASQVAQGLLDEEQAASHPKRHVLIQCLGLEPDLHIDVTLGHYTKDSLFLMCSDGYHSLFSNAVIAERLQHLLSTSSHQIISEQFISDAKLHPNVRDNITVMLLQDYTDRSLKRVTQWPNKFHTKK